MEIWKQVVGYEGIYEISDTGKVKSLDRMNDSGMGRVHFKPGRILKAAIGSHGYYGVALCKNKKQVSTCIHRIIAEAFIPNPNGYNYINHKDGNRVNNSIENLEWCTQGQNVKHSYDVLNRAPSRKVTTEQVYEIRQLAKLGVRMPKIASHYGIKRTTVSSIVNFKTRING